MREIIVATKNKGKVAEIAAILGALPVKVLAITEFGGIPEADETGDTFFANAVIKARHYARLTGRACLADDSGLEVDALDGAPGVHSARFAGDDATDEANNRKLLTLLAGVPFERRTARFRCTLIFFDNRETLIAVDGTCEGIILEEPRGEGGFGYDPLFYIPELEKTLAEIPVENKNIISHRGRALQKMLVELRGYLP